MPSAPKVYLHTRKDPEMERFDMNFTPTSKTSIYYFIVFHHNKANDWD